ncbi:MAG: cytochrome ubiquinol oxidase subunit I [Syntrophorhabdus aromaticivorans]|uniref:Cytochrome ubiquinol oxidase subunit I n=1 Tax=Syntrophorhabdus aromaticivorans TaxID=328301 RepID=A0A971M3T4_9BACT|nr:cytochrome ubiquinol oxidase subunit I [Syntrophorhabdus aromaticivorans]
MDTLMLSRLQFAVATYFHFLFVPLTLGLSLLIAIMETIYAVRGSEEYRAMARFWGKLFLINFAMGVVTGLTLEFQFGTNWSRYSRYVGDIFGPLLAIEATVTFFLESTFIAVWAFGWNRLSPKVHALAIWLVALASSMSAVWILIANSWMQSPVGFAMKNGRPVLSDFMAIVTQGYAILTILHTLAGSYIVAGFFVMGISAYHLLRKPQAGFFLRSFRIALIFALVFSIFEVVEGHMHGAGLALKQPAKLASLEAHWNTSANAPVYLLAVPDPENDRNSIEIGRVPGALSLLAFHTPAATVTGLKDIPRDQRPPVTPTFVSFRLMVMLGMLFLLLTVTGFFLRNRLPSCRLYLKVMIYAIPLPYVACALGWTVTEIGRQPWIVYGLMKTAEAVSPVSSSQVAASLAAFTIVYTLLGIAAFSLIARQARKGPDAVPKAQSAG